MSQAQSHERLPAEQQKGEASEATLVLITRARGGDSDALNDLCARYLPRLTRWAHGRLPSGARGALDTHDIVQETLAHVVQRLPDFEPRHEGAFQGYLRRALLNRIRDEARKLQRKGPAEPLENQYRAADPSPLEEAIGQEALELYEAALTRLRGDDREAIIARIELGLPYAELAPLLGKPTISAAHMAVSRALLRLAKEMTRGKNR
ncbi:MAG TPA: sigma-70 family RNA polymerase sigma factor [Vicinamibacterales bacterium]